MERSTSSPGISPKQTRTGGTLRSASSGTLRASGVTALANSSGVNGESWEAPKLPRYLSVNKLTRRRRLDPSTQNVHGYKAEDYHQLSWPLPKMFGEEKYSYSLIDIEDPRYLSACAEMSKKLIRLQYDAQIVDLEWRKTYKELLAAEHHHGSLGQPHPGPPSNKTYNPETQQERTKEILKKRIENAKAYLLQLQDQKDRYEVEVQAVYDRCATIKATIQKETDLEELRLEMETRAKQTVSESTLWRKFNARSAQPAAGTTLGGIVDFNDM